MGFVSKKRMGARSIDANIRLCRTRAAFTQRKYNIIARPKLRIIEASIIPEYVAILS